MNYCCIFVLMRTGSPPFCWDPAVALWKMWVHIQHLENIDQAMYYLGCECGCVQPHVWKSVKLMFLLTHMWQQNPTSPSCSLRPFWEFRKEWSSPCSGVGIRDVWNCVIFTFEWANTVSCTVCSVLYTQVQARIYRCKKSVLRGKQCWTKMHHFN